ncbi:MAG: ABC transporter substrate-binding protein [Deltaproteobacteria bacterium]|nr:ABC transporter substrate-binding protein [Deltaproteobacteria bacterium]
MMFLKMVCLSFVAAYLGYCPVALAASATSGLEKAQKDATAKGLIFLGNREEIVSKAKTEGKLRVLAEMEPPNIKASVKAFMQKYPFINLYVEEITGTDSARRSILEIKSGAAKDWDIVHLNTDFYHEYLPYLWQIDLLGMAEQRVLQIPPQMIDPKHRNVVAFFSRFQVTAYNKKLLPTSHQLKRWEDILKPDFKGRKFAADIRPTEIAALTPAWGLEKTLDFARKVAAQQPIWVRGGSRTLTSIIAGEVPMMIGPNFHTVKRSQAKDPSGSLQYVLLEPVPLRRSMEEAMLASSQNRHAALLWLEWMASPEAQKLADEHEPFGSSVHVLGGAVERELKGKQLSLVSWEHHQNMDQWQAKVLEAYGFPKAERSK